MLKQKSWLWGLFCFISLLFFFFLLNYKVILTRICFRLRFLQFFREAFYDKLGGCRMSETHLSQTLTAEVRRLDFKPQAVGATKGGCDWDSDGRF